MIRVLFGLQMFGFSHNRQEVIGVGINHNGITQILNIAYGCVQNWLVFVVQGVFSVRNWWISNSGPFRSIQVG